MNLQKGITIVEINKVWKRSATAIALLTVTMLGAIALTADACTKASQARQTSHRVVRNTKVRKATVKKTAQPKQAAVRRTCAKVVAENTSGENAVYKLNVRSRIFGPVIEQLEDDTTVTVIRRFPNGWVEISNPVQGYIFGEFLTGC